MGMAIKEITTYLVGPNGPKPVECNINAAYAVEKAKALFARLSHKYSDCYVVQGATEIYRHSEIAA